jgi:hypothetical protein
MPSKETSTGELCAKDAENDIDLQDKIQLFLTDRSIETVTGIRRMGRDNLVEFISKMSLKTRKVCSIYPETEGDIVIFYHWEGMDLPALNILKEYPDKDILYGQDLCHQVPAVVRYNVKKKA